ncbi:hypothetical protein LSTR_LSTR017199 [Laodelphax striatellus]|uniref:Acyltransferase 3 domain-containing protein n=1 Tax=Laodelphax striatellus TaxID=195883 RepID=A0A482WYR0_LAOST|nr:hypothetical protein LSTR_LSTR017199 [Laodelphax striatellus]
MKWVIIFSLLLVITASTVDISYFRSKKQVNDTKKGNMHSLMLSYSIYENFLNLKKPDPSDEFASLHGMRTYSMFLIILGHRCLFTYGGPFHNPEFLEERFRCFTDMFLLNGTLIVDTFFLLSSFLTCYMLLLEMQKRKKMDFLSVYIYRWTR